MTSLVVMSPAAAKPPKSINTLGGACMISEGKTLMPQYTESLSGPQCPRCGVTGPHTVGDGAGPHTARLLCRQCGYFLQWLSTQPPEERAAKRESARRQWMRTQPATARQLSYLTQLGYGGPPPANRLDASDLIQQRLPRGEE